MIANIQLLRALAAYMVVVHHVIDAVNHYIGRGRYSIEISTFASGVDIFFVISGYIMASTTTARAQGPLDFLRHRIARVAPLYYLASAIAAALFLSGFKIFGRTSLDIGDLLQTITFIPRFDAAGRPLDPIVFVGWTLQYEMFFYVVVALLLTVRDVRVRAALVVSSLLALVLVGQLGGPSIVRYYAHPIVLEFAAGYALYFLLRSYCPSRGAAVVILGLGLLSLVATMGAGKPDELRVLLYGVPATLLVFGAVALSMRGADVRSIAALRQGNASYSLYLVHPFVIQAIGKVANQVPWTAGVPGLLATCAVMLLASAIAGLVAHEYIERKISRTMAPAGSGAR